jgi:hypothetical protein
MKCLRCGEEAIFKEEIIGQVMPGKEGVRTWKNHGTIFNHGGGRLCAIPVDGEPYEILVFPDLQTSAKV